MGIVSAITALVMPPLAVICSSRFIDFTGWLPDIPAYMSGGLIPMIVILAALTGFYIIMKKRYAASNNEAIQTLFILLLVAYVILTVICYWFRGAGMELGWRKKILNVQLSTSNFHRRKKQRTSNVQLSTFNIEQKNVGS
jgi:hypothetical protein